MKEWTMILHYGIGNIRIQSPIITGHLRAGRRHSCYGQFVRCQLVGIVDEL